MKTAQFAHLINIVIADMMTDKTYEKNKTKETTDPNLNDFEINDNSTTIYNLTTITGLVLAMVI